MKGDWMYEDVPVLGRMSAADASRKLRDVGETAYADLLENVPLEKAETFSVFGLGKEPKYAHTAHSFGYIGLDNSLDKALQIHSVASVEGDESLRGSRIRITLDGIRVADYPGNGIHRVLFDFYAHNQVAGDVEHLHFNSTLRIAEGESAAVVGYPIFVGLTVPADGVALKCLTVNVKNDDDERLLAELESDVFRSGLKLATTLQPAIAPLAGLATALTKSVASRTRNVPVQEFYLGLDFGKVATRAHLREGSYVAVQIPEKFSVIWDWSKWVFHRSSGRIVGRDEETLLVPYNYIIFSVSKYEGE